MTTLLWTDIQMFISWLEACVCAENILIRLWPHNVSVFVLKGFILSQNIVFVSKCKIYHWGFSGYFSHKIWVLYSASKANLIWYKLFPIISAAVTPFMHQGCASEHSLSPSHMPSPCILVLPTSCPTPPLLTAPPCHLVLFTQLRTNTHTHAHSQESFLLISFHSEKQDEGALSDLRLPWKPPYSSSVRHSYIVTHSYTESDRMLDI